MLYKHGTSAFEVPDRFRREKGGLAREETPGRSQILAGWTVVLVALLYSSMQPLSAKARSETQIIEQARPLILAQETRDMPLEDIAKSLNISYTSFRRTFREHTGASPHQYRLHRKISAARELLRSTDLRVKESVSMRIR